MLIVEIVALRQTNLKRIFAYSSLGQVALLFTAFAMQNENANRKMQNKEEIISRFAF